MARPRALIVGAGSLGLGFLCERLAPDYDVCLADLENRAAFLERVRAEGGFTLNVCGPGGLEVRRVRGSFTHAVTGTPGFSDEVERADLVLTAVGARALPAAAAAVAATVNRHLRPAWILFCENGREIARRYDPWFASSATLADTVMSRMCRMAEPGETGFAPFWPGHDQALVVESHPGIPLDRDRSAGGPFGAAFTMVAPEEFRTWEDVKLYMHNGMHAFLSYHAFLEGVDRFPRIPAPLRAEAERVMMKEVAPAVLFHHPSARRADVVGYGAELLRRMLDPVFNDSIERGVRGAAEKLQPGERLLGGQAFIRAAGIEPRGYSTTIEAARRIAEMQRAAGGA
jgi:mannitol-1-phosphate/altronate dehydrogenase